MKLSIIHFIFNKFNINDIFKDILLCHLEITVVLLKSGYKASLGNTGRILLSSADLLVSTPLLRKSTSVCILYFLSAPRIILTSQLFALFTFMLNIQYLKTFQLLIEYPEDDFIIAT